MANGTVGQPINLGDLGGGQEISHGVKNTPNPVHVNGSHVFIGYHASFYRLLPAEKLVEMTNGRAGRGRGRSVNEWLLW